MSSQFLSRDRPHQVSRMEIDSEQSNCFTYRSNTPALKLFHKCTKRESIKQTKKLTVNETVTNNLLMFEEIPFHFLTMTFFRVTRTQAITETTCTPSSAYFLIGGRFEKGFYDNPNGRSTGTIRPLSLKTIC